LKKSAKETKNSFELEALEPRVLLSADAFMAAATLANAVHKTTEVTHQAASPDHTAFQDNLAYQPAEPGGIFDGVASQAIQSHETASTQSATHAGSQTAPATATSSSQDAATVVQAKTTKAATILTGSTPKLSTAATTLSATSTTATNSVATQQMTASLKVANAPPTGAANVQTANNKTITANSNVSNNSSPLSSSSTAKPLNATSAVDLFLTVNNALNAIATGTTPAPINVGDASLGGVLNITGVQISFSGITVSGGAVAGGTVTVTATSASLNLGGNVTSTIGAITGNYDISTKSFSLTLKNVSIAFSSFVNISAASANLTYSGATTTSVTLTDGTNASTKDVSLVTIGISSATVFAGVNGPASDSNAAGVELSSASLALALMSAPDGTTYYGLETTAGSLTAVGLPGGFTMSATNLQVDVNGSNDGNNVVNFDSSFTSATSSNGHGLDVSTGTGSINLDYQQQIIAASGTIELDFNGFVYIHGSLAITSVASTTVYLNDGTTTSATPTTVSELLIGADNVTVFVGLNGPATSSSAVGVELDGAGLALAIFKPVTGTDTYYGLQATATSLSGVGLPNDITVSATEINVQINGNSNSAGPVVDFVASFGPGGLAVPTSSSTSVNLTFTSAIVQVAGAVTFDIGSYLQISGGFSFTKNSAEMDIEVGATAFTGAQDLSFSIGSFVTATGSLSMVIDANSITINQATLTVAGTFTLGSILTVDTPGVSISNFAIDRLTGSISGTGTGDPTIEITAGGASLFPGNSSITATISPTDPGGTGLDATFDLVTNAFSINVQQFELVVGSVLTADASGVLIAYNPADNDPHQQLVQIKSGTIAFGQFGISGGLTNLTIYKDGFNFDSVTIAYTKPVKLGSVLTLADPSLTLTNFGVTFSGGNASVSETGSLTVSVASGSLTVGPVSVNVTDLSITVGLDPGSNLGDVTVTASSLSLAFSTYVSIQATDITINTDPGVGNAYFTVGTATATLTAGSVSISGSASNFSVIDADANGTAAFQAGTNFSVSFSASVTQLDMPSWLGIQIQKFEIQWPDFSGDPTNFKLILSASINSIQGLPDGVTVSGEITDAVIDIGKLEAGQFPITSIGSVGGSVSGSLFGMQVNAGFVLGVVNFNKESQIVNADGTVVELTTDSHGNVTETPVTTNPDKVVKNSVMYVGVEGGATIPGVGGVQIYIGFSALGPLTVYMSAEFPLLLDPDTGIAIGGFSGGVIFDYTIPTPSKPQDLAAINLSPAGLTASQWQQQLRDQTVTQYTATGGGTNLLAAYTQPFVIEAGVTLYDAYLSADAFTITGNIAIQINPAQPDSVGIFVTGTATFGGSLSFNAYLYLNITVSGATSTATVMFLAEAPADTPVESFGGSVTFGFTEGGVPVTPTASTTAFSEWIALGTAYDSTGAASINNLPAGTYVWTPGANDISLTVGGTTYLASSAVNGQVDFTTTAASAVTFAGTAGTTMTGTLGNVLASGDLLPSGAQYAITTFNPPPPVDGFYISLTGFLEYQVPGDSNINVSINGAVTLTVTTTMAKLDLWGDLNVSFLGEIAVAQGEFVVDYTNPGTPEFYGALLVKTGAGLAALQSYGLTVSGALLFQVNTTGTDVSVNLPNAPPTAGPPATGKVAPLDSTNSTAFTIQGSVIFDLTILGVDPTTSPYATLDYSVNGTTIFDLQGYFDLRLTDDPTAGVGLQILAEIHALNIGSTGSASNSPALISFSGFGLFIVNSQGFAAEINLTLTTNNIPDFSLTGDFTLVINTTSQDVTYTIPSTATLPPGTGGNLGASTVPGVTVYDSNGNVVGTATTLVIPAGPPHGLATLDTSTATASFTDTGAAGPYIVVAGNGTLTVLNTLTLTGSFRFELSYSSADGLLISMIVNVTADLSGVSGAGGAGIGSGALAVTGAIQIATGGADQGIAALLSVGGGTTQTTDYGNFAGGSGVELTANFQLGINTTGSDITSIGGVNLKDSAGNPVTLTSKSFQMLGTGTLAIDIAGTGFMITGSIFASASSGGFTISVNGVLTATVAGASLLTMNASGTLTVTSGGAVYGALELTLKGSNPLSGTGFSFNGSFDLELNTDPTLTPSVTVNGNAFNLAAGPYVEVHASGDLIFGTATNGFQLAGGNFYLAIGTNGLTVSASATMVIEVGGTQLLSIGATGGMLITSTGFAASLTVTTTLTDPSSGTKYYAFNGTFSLQINTTGATQTIIVDPSTNPATTVTLAAGPYFQMYVHGSLALGGTDTAAATGMLMTGDFYLSISSAGLAVSATSTLYLKVAGTDIFTFTANGALLITSDGIAAKFNLTIGTGNSNAGFAFGGSVTFTLALNTTSSTSFTINNQTFTLPAGPYFQVTASGSLVLGGFVNVNGTFTLTVGTDADGNSAVVIQFAATAGIFGVTFGLAGDAGIYSNGIAIKLSLSIGGNSSNPSATVIPGVLSVTGTFTLELNLTGQSHFGIAGTTAFEVMITNFSVNLFGFSLVGGNGHPDYLEFLVQNDGSFYCSGSLDFNFFGFGDVSITFDFDSHGHYTFTGSLYVQLGSDSFNIHGTLYVHISNEAAPNFELRVDGGVTAFDYTFASVGADIQINGTDVSISAYVSVNLGLFSIGGTVTIDLGSIGAAPPQAPPPADLATLNNGVLTLNLGADAQNRFFQGSAITAMPDENYTIELAPGTTNGLENIWVIAPGVYSGPAEYAGTSTAIPGSPPAGAVEYDGVSSIVANNTGSSNTTITVAGFVTAPVTITAGSGKNQFIMGGGLATIYGTTGKDTVIGGSGGVNFHAGSGASVFIGGNGNNTIYDPGTVSIIEGYATQTATYDSGTSTYTYSLVSVDYSYYGLSGSTLTYGDGTTNYTDTLVGTFAMVTLTAPGSGAATFAVSNYSGNVTLNANGNSNVATAIETDAGSLSLTGSVVTQSNGVTGTITLQSNVTTTNSSTGVLATTPYTYGGTLALYGGSGNNTFTVSSWSGSGAITLDGKGGSDTYIINFQSSGSFTATVSDSGATGTDALTLYGTTGNDTINVSGSVVSLASQTVNYSGMENLAVYTRSGNDIVNLTGTSAATSINAGSGNDTFNIISISNPTAVTLGSGVNTVNVGTQAPTETGGTLNSIQATLTVTGGNGGTDTLYLDDSADNSAATATLTATSLTGVFGSGGSLAYSGIASFNLYLGSGDHTVNVQGMNGTVNIVLGGGTNILNIGSNAGPIVTDPNSGNAANTGSVLTQMTGVLNFTGAGDNIVNVDDSGSNQSVDGALTPTSIQFLNLVTINLPNVVALNISLSQSDDLFAVADTFASASVSPVIVIDGNGGDDAFVVTDTHAVMTINGGDGGDSFYNFGNSSVLYLNGNAGDDSFFIYASVSENTSNVNAGAADSNGNTIYSYRVNAPVNIDGGSGNDKLYIFGTVLNDVITINGSQVTGAGIDVTFTNIEQLTVEGLGGNDTFYIEAITIPTTVVGDGSRITVPPAYLTALASLGVVLPNLDGNAPPATSFNDTFYVGWQGASYIPGSLAGIVAPLTIYGDNGPNGDGSTTNTPGTTDTIYVDDSGDTAGRNFLLTSTTLTSDAMGPNGLINYDSAVENLNISAGPGNNTITVNGTGAATQTSIYGGSGNDAFVVNVADGGSLASPLALFGGLNTFAGDTLTVNGAPGGNTFDLTGFTIDGAGATISYEQMERLTINAGGATAFNVNGDSVPTYLNGGAANDTFTVNNSGVPLYLDGGAGDDTFIINANSGTLTATGDAGNDSFTVNGNSGSISLNGGDGNDAFVINGNSGSMLVVNGDAGNDSFTVNANSAPATLNGGAGDDSFTVNAPLAASLTVIGGGDAGDLLTVNGTTGNDFFTVTGSTVSGVGAPINYNVTNLVVNGVAGNDTFFIDGTTTGTTWINGAAHSNDTFNVQATAGALYLAGGVVGGNVFNLGSLAPLIGGTLAGIVGPVFVSGGTNTVNVDDTGDAAGNSGTLTATTLTGFGMGAGITYSGVVALNISLGSGGDIFNVQSTHATTVTTLNTGLGANVVNVGSLAPMTGGIVDGIQGALIIVGGGNDTLNVDDTGSAPAKTGTLTATTLTGLGMGAAGITYSGVIALNISLGSGSDIFNVQSTHATTVTTLNTGLGANVVNVGSLAPATGGIVDGIQGALILQGSGNDTLNVDDTGTTADKTGTLTATTLTGLGMGENGIAYSGLAVLNISLGSGNDTFTINSVSPSTAMTVDAGAGIDTAILSFAGSVVIDSLTLLNFEDTTLHADGDFTGVLNDSGPMSQVTIVGAFTAGSELDASAIGTMTVGGDLAGVVNVTGLLDTLTVDGGTPGKIVAGNINVITVLAGYGNKVLQVVEGGIERQIQATPVGGGLMPDTIHFAFVYDSETAGDPQLAIRITNDDPAARSFNLVLAVINSSTAKFNLSRVDSNLGGASGVSNVALQGDLLTKLTAPELQLFTDLTAGSSGGVVLAADSITGVEVSGRLPIGFINVAGIEGVAFSVLTTAAGKPVSLLKVLGSANKPQVLWNLLGSRPSVNAATDTFVVPFNETGSVRLYANDNTSLDLQLVMTLTDPLNDNAPVTAYVQIDPSLVRNVNPLIQSLAFIGAGASVNTTLSIASITSTGPLGSITITAAAGATVGGFAGLGSITATSIVGSINVTKAGIYGTIQTTEGDLGATIFRTNGTIAGVTTISAHGAITGQIISRGNLVSLVKTNGDFTGVIAAQGDIGAVLRDGAGNAVTSSSGALSRFGGISISGNDSGEIIALGNIFGDVTTGKTLTGRIAAEGQTVGGLAAARLGILGKVTIKSFAAKAAIVSGGLMGDATGKTLVTLGSPNGFLAAVGGINLKKGTKIPAGNLFQNVSGPNLSAINAIFTNASAPLAFDTGGNLAGLGLIETDLLGLGVSGGSLTGTTP
jgi:hypothetical protein